jgi:hypothetical protein
MRKVFYVILLFSCPIFAQVQDDIDMAQIGNFEIYNYIDWQLNTAGQLLDDQEFNQNIDTCVYCETGGWRHHVYIDDTIWVGDRARNVLRFALDPQVIGASHGGQFYGALSDSLEECYLTYNIFFSGDCQDAGYSNYNYHWKRTGKISGVNGEPVPAGDITAVGGFKAGNAFGRTGTISVWLKDGNHTTGQTHQWNHRGGLFRPDHSQWYQFTMRYVMNTPGTGNGLLEAFVNGEKWLEINDVEYRNANRPNLGVNTLKLYAFHGGSDTLDRPWWQSRQFISDVVVWGYSDTINNVHGKDELHDTNSVLITPFQPFSYVERFEDTLVLEASGANDTIDIANDSYPGAYSRHSNEKWLITAPSGYAINFVVETIDMRSTEGYGDVTMFDGDNVYSTILLQVNGTSEPNPVTTTGSRAVIWFKTPYLDPTGRTGFDGYVNAVPL